MRPDGMSPLTSGLEENAAQNTKNMYRYLLRDSRQRLVFLWPSTFLLLLCSISTVDALAFYVGTSNGQTIREQPKAVQRTENPMYREQAQELLLSKDDRQTIVTVCKAAHFNEKFRSKLKDPVEFLKICEQLLREFRKLKLQASENQR